MTFPIPLNPDTRKGLSNSAVPTTGSGNYQPQVVDPFIQQATSKYGIPNAILKGVFGMETAFGANVKTSSAGAEGPFQFIRSTAQQYGYPYTNSPTIGQFQQQADSAAHYLSDLYKQHGGNWDAALRAYSGGAYGLAEVNAKAKANVNSSEGPLSSLPSVSQLTPDIPGAISGVFNQAVTDAKYAAVLIGVLIVAVVLMTHGLRSEGPTNKPMVIPV